MPQFVVGLTEPLFMEFSIPLSKEQRPLHKQIYSGLRRAILIGIVGSDTRLPSTRDLAEQLGVSRSVVLEAYDQLLAEGFVIGRSGSGTYVAQGLSSNWLARSKKSTRLRLSGFGSTAVDVAENLDASARSTRYRYDFKFGRSESDIETFPFEYWQRILTRRARKTSVAELDYGPAAGNSLLRDAICTHLRRSRTLVCDPSDVIITNGSQQALDLIARVLLERGDRVAIENPSYQGTRQILLAAGARLIPVQVDRNGLNPAKLPENARLCFVTPSHQFPTGAILPLVRRLALIEWAKRKNTVIVEDDYDGEFHYAGQPLESLQGLDSDGRIIYVGTFSRTVFPSLRVGYLVVPKSLIAAFTGAKWINDQHSAILEQQTLAEFITAGAYERHLRRVRRRNSARREALLNAIHKYLGERVDVTGDGAGAHVAMWPRRRVSEAALIDAAGAHEVGIYGISRYFVTKAAKTGVLLGYSRMKEAEIQEGIRRLSEVL
jgi:GntR family transcriptional regulator/MocR family aminotransferase